MGGLAIGAGLALGGLGAILGSKGASDAAAADAAAKQKAMELFDNEANLRGRANQLAYALGPAEAKKILKGSLSQEQYNKVFGTPGTPAQNINPAGANGDATAIDNKIEAILGKGWASKVTGLGGPNGAGMTPANIVLYATGRNDRTKALELENLLGQKSLIQQANGKPINVPEIPPQPGLIDEASFDALGPGYIGEQNALADTFAGKGRDTLNQFDLATGGLNRQADEITNYARNIGDREKTRINTEADRALTGANRLTTSRLARMGLGNSTLATQELSGNARSINEGRDNAFGALADRQIQTVGQFMGNKLSLNAGRAGQRTTLGLGLDERDLGLRGNALSAKQALFTSPAQNPYLGQDTTRFFSSASPGAAASMSFGNSLSQLGGYGLSYGLSTMGKGGGGGAANPYAIDQSYSPGSTQYGSNRPR